MEDTYNKSAAFWMVLRRELQKTIAEKEAFLEGGLGTEDLDVSSEDDARSVESDLRPDYRVETASQRSRFFVTAL